MLLVKGVLLSLFAHVLVGVAAYGVPSCGRPRSVNHRAAVRLQDAMVGGMPGQSAAVVSSETYGLMLSTLLKTNESVSAQISANYAMVDYAFLQRLDEAIAEGNEDMAPRLHEIKSAVNEEMATRMQAAATAMKELVQSPTAVVMEGKIAGLARQGRLDDALLQLLEANLQQAQQAGEQGKGAVQVISRLQQRVQVELDKKLAPEVSLLRRLIRMDDSDARQKLLREKMTPKKATTIILSTVSTEAEKDAKDTKPEISPREVAAAIQDIKLRFGNVDENYDTGFVARLDQIADEAEAIALDLAGGKELTSRQAQDMAWDQASVSVWDLEAIEEEAHQDGKLAVWEDEAQAQMARQDSAMRKSAVEGDFAS